MLYFKFVFNNLKKLIKKFRYSYKKDIYAYGKSYKN